MASASPQASLKVYPILNNVKVITDIKKLLFNSIFLDKKYDKNLLTKLGELYNCDIQFTETTRTTTIANEITDFNIFITPKDCNYFIHVKHAPISADKTHLTFTLSSKQGDMTNYEPGFSSLYVVEDDKIKHSHINLNLQPVKSTKIKSILSDNKYTVIFNPYIKLNQLLKKNTNIHVNHMTKINELQKIVMDIEKLKLSDNEKKDLDRIKNIFSDYMSKNRYDNKLKDLLPYSYRRKAQDIESLDYHYKRFILYESNLPINNLLGNRYAQYYHDFEFIKKVKSIKLDKINQFLNFEYIKYIPFGLNKPFTITDIYMHKFPYITYHNNTVQIVHDVHPYNTGAKDVFKLNNDVDISRAFDLIELSKSIIFTFVSIYNVLKKKLPNITQDPTIIDIPFRLFNVYTKLPWTNIEDGPNNMILESIKHLTLLKMTITKKNDLALTLNLKYENKHHKQNGSGVYEKSIDYLMPCLEAPFKFMQGIVREPFTSINKLELNQQVYQLGEIPLKSISEGFENILLTEENINTRLSEHRSFNFDMHSILSQMTHINMNTFDMINEEVPELTNIDFDSTNMTELFPEIIIDKKEQTEEQKAQDAKFEEIRLVEQSKRDITLRLAQEQLMQEEEEIEAEEIEAEELRKREEARDMTQKEEEPDESQTYEENPNIINEVNYKEINRTLAKIKKQLELTNTKIDDIKDEIEGVRLISTDEAYSVQMLRPMSSQTIKTDADKQIKIKSLESALFTLKDNQIKYRMKIDELQRKVDNMRNPRAGMNSRKKKSDKRDGKKSETSYKDDSRTKYLKYKAKYLALKQQYNL